MWLDFTKMQGAGNDFAVFDLRGLSRRFSERAIRALSDRRTGIGCDQFISIEPPRTMGADAFMRIGNPDGTEAGACGNATRCVAALLALEFKRQTLTIETVSGLLSARILPDGQVEVDMGPARLDWRDIPLAHEVDTLHLPLPGDPAAVSMGNPHATFFVPNLQDHPVTTQGPIFEHDPLFPARANIGFAQILSPEHIRLRVWERGAGLTLACGSGACATLVNAHRRGLTGRWARVDVDGGALRIEWRIDGHVLMTGPATTVFQGRVQVADDEWQPLQ